jgi:aspartate ammonia-lyase
MENKVMTTPIPADRTEHDSMGDRSLPASAYYGIQTLRATENFAISGLRPLSTYVDACVLIKKAAGNRQTGNSVAFLQTSATQLSRLAIKS